MGIFCHRAPSAIILCNPNELTRRTFFWTKAVSCIAPMSCHTHTNILDSIHLFIIEPFFLDRMKSHQNGWLTEAKFTIADLVWPSRYLKNVLRHLINVSRHLLDVWRHLIPIWSNGVFDWQKRRSCLRNHQSVSQSVSEKKRVSGNASESKNR